MKEIKGNIKNGLFELIENNCVVQNHVQLENEISNYLNRYYIIDNELKNSLYLDTTDKVQYFLSSKKVDGVSEKTILNYEYCLNNFKRIFYFFI